MSELPRGYRLRRRTPADDAALVGVENRAAELFRSAGHPRIADQPIPDVAFLRRLMRGRETLVAADAAGRPVGFAVSGPCLPYLHLHELSVDPAHGRRGIGRALVAAVAARAAGRGLAGVSLTTFRAVPFNAPFYASLGFAELPLAAAPPALARLFHDEVPAGVDPATRVLMTRPG